MAELNSIPIPPRAELLRRGIGEIEVIWHRPPRIDALSYLAGGVATFSLAIATHAVFPALEPQLGEGLSFVQETLRANLLTETLGQIAHALR